MTRRNYPRASSRSYQGTCAVCGDRFLTGYPYTLYCGPECRQEAAAERLRGRQPLPPARAGRQASEPAAVTGGIETRAWHGAPIHRRESDGWVNATAMCQAGGKRWNDYIRLDRTSEYVCALQHAITGQTRCAAAVAGNPATLPAVIETRQGGAPHLQGTWVHPRLAVDLARWISPAFAVWMDGWFLESMGQPQPKPQPTLRKGVYVIADTRREAAELWWAALRDDVMGALSRRHNPTYRTDAGLPYVYSYRWEQPSLL